MALDPAKNFAKVRVSTGYDAAATSISLTSGDGAKLPAPGTDGSFNLVWWNESDYPNPSDDPNVEIVRCTARATDALTISRAQEGTSASTKNASGKSYKMALGFTKKMRDDIESRIAGTEAAVATAQGTADAAIPKSLIDAKGDIIAGTADNTVAVLSVGSDGQVLTADSGQAAGVKWATPAGGTPGFGGSGADGALSVSSGTTTIDLGSASIVEKNYSSISITGTGAIAFSNPGPKGTYIIFRCSGACTITSSATRAIDLRSLGGIAPTSGGSTSTSNSANPSGVGTDGAAGLSGGAFLSAADSAGKKGTGTPGVGGSTAAGGAATTAAVWAFKPSASIVKRVVLSGGFGGGTGAAGGSGSGSSGNGGTSGGVGGAGGDGAGSLYIECAGALNFTGTIDASGKNGTTGATGGSHTSGGGGGGGGGGGCVFIFYGSLTANSGTINVAGGNGGNGGPANGGASGNAGCGGAGASGGASVFYNGGKGGDGGYAGNHPATDGGAGSGTGGGTAGTAGGGDSGTYGSGATIGSGGGGGGGGAGYSVVAQAS